LFLTHARAALVIDDFSVAGAPNRLGFKWDSDPGLSFALNGGGVFRVASTSSTLQVCVGGVV
jgi:hypothetical protein